MVNSIEGLAFTDEFLRIKLAESQRHQREPVTAKDTIKSFRNFAIGAIPFGLGTASGYALSGKPLEMVFKKLTPTQRAVVAGSAGLLSGAGALAWRHAMAKNREMVRAEIEREKAREQG